MQQETIINIEKSSEGVNYELEQGNKHVTTAVSTAKSTRKVRVPSHSKIDDKFNLLSTFLQRKLFCFIIFLILLVVAAVLVWWFAFPKARSSQSIDVKIIPAVTGSGDNIETKTNATLNLDGKQTTVN